MIFMMMNSVDLASLVGDWRNVWEPKILDGGDKEESSKALQSKLEGIFLLSFIDVLASNSHGSQDF